ncbi:MAG: hypothetical protein R6V04_07020 [bacterium]
MIQYTREKRLTAVLDCGFILPLTGSQGLPLTVVNVKPRMFGEVTGYKAVLCFSPAGETLGKQIEKFELKN